MNGRKILSITLLCAMMMSIFLIYQEQAEAYTVDFIVLTDGPDGPEIMNMDLPVGGSVEIWASAYNNSGGFIDTIPVGWNQFPVKGNFTYSYHHNTTFTAGITPGVTTITGENLSWGVNDSFDINILTPTADFIFIRDAAGGFGNVISDQQVNLGYSIEGYSAGYNYTTGYVGDVSVSWSVNNTGNASANTLPSSGPNSTFDAGSTNGTTTWMAFLGPGIYDTVEFLISNTTIDFITIVDTMNAGATEIPDQTIDVAQSRLGYAAAFNSTYGYLGDISVTWSVNNVGGSTAFTNPTSGTGSTFNSGTTGGTATWTANDGIGHTDTVVFTINAAVIDYIRIVYTPGSGSPELPDQTIDIGFNVTGFAAAFNNSIGYLNDVSATWSVINTDGASAYTTPSTGTNSTFYSGSTYGNATWKADDGTGHNDTVLFTITSGINCTVDYIRIVDSMSPLASVIPDMNVTTGFVITGFAAAYNYTYGYLDHISVSWNVSNSGGAAASTDPAAGIESTFNSGPNYGQAMWNAEDGSGHDVSVVFTMIQPDYIVIVDSSGTGATEIPDQTVTFNITMWGYAAGFNGTSGYIGDVVVNWTVSNFGSAAASTNPPSGNSSSFNSGLGEGTAIWTANDGSGHTDTVVVNITDPSSFTVDYIILTISPNGRVLDYEYLPMGNDMTIYASGYNTTVDYVGLVEVDWSQDPVLGSFNVSVGKSTTFTGLTQGVTNITGENLTLALSDSFTVEITGPPPEVDYIEIHDGPNGTGNPIPDQIVPAGFIITGYAAGFNNSGGYVQDVSVDWSVINLGTNASTNPIHNTWSTFNFGPVPGTAIWTADDGFGHNYSVEFNTIPPYDFILIVDTSGTGTTEIPDATVDVGFTIQGYAAAFNNSASYIGDISVTWTVQNSGGATASTNPSSGTSSQFFSGATGGTATWTANDGLGNTDTVVFTITPPVIDYIHIVDDMGNGSIIPDQTINVNTNITGYAAAFNDSIGYMGDISVMWSVTNFDGASASTAPLTGTASVFNSGSTNGNATWKADDGAGHTDTVTFTIIGQIYTIDYISIRDAPGENGDIIGDRTHCVFDTGTFYAVGFNSTIGYVTTVEVTWESNNESIGNVTTPGVSTLFTAQWIAADDICIVTATYNTLTNTTGNLEVLSPRTDFIQIRDAPNGGGAIITSISYNKGDEDVFYGAAYNNTVDFIGDVPSSATWDSTNPLIVNVSSPGPFSTVKCSDMNSGTVTVTLTVGLIHINTTIVVVLEWEVDYIIIRDAPSGGGKNLCDPMNYPSYPVGHETTFYGAMYNITVGYIGDVGSNSNWSSDDTSIVEVTSPGVYSIITCSDTNSGTVIIGLEEWMGHNATTLVTVIEPTLDYITVVDAPGGSGNPIGDMTYEIGDEDTYYAAAFNVTAGYLFDVSVSWSSSDTSVGTVDPITGSSTVFTAEGMGKCIVTADYGPGISDTTGILTVTLPSNITVGNSGGAHFTTIQEAINNAQEGDTVFVYSGTYHEHLFIDKSITLMGEDRYYTIIDGDGYGKVIFVTGDNVNIRGFTIQDGEYGIYCQETDTTTIEYNIIYDYDYGIYCNQTIDGYIAHNTITAGQYGIVTFEAYNDAIRYNTISHNSEYGAKDYNSQLKYCFNWNYFHNNTIAYYYDPDTTLEPIEFDGNILENNHIGIKVENADTITITNNTLEGNGYGILLLNASPNIADNTISSSEYGIYGEYSSPTISNNVISDILEHGIFAIFGDSLKIINNTMMGTDMIFIDSTILELWAEDTRITKVNTTVEEPHLDEESAFEVQWSLRVRVLDEEGEPVEDAVVLIYDAFDNLVTVQDTDSEGWIASIRVIEKEEGGTTTLIYNPYTVRVIKGDAEDTQTITVEGDTEHIMSIDTGGAIITPSESVFPWLLAFALVLGTFIVIGLGGITIEVMKYGLLALFLPLFSRIKKGRLLEQPIRHRIHGYIIGNPGAHYGLIKQELGIPNGQLVYHLNQLTKAHLIYSREDGIRKRFYPVALPVPKGGKIYLTKVQKEILDVVEESSGANQKEIASSMGVSRQVAGYHLTKMEEKGFVRKEFEGRETRYYPLENVDA